MNTKKKFSLLIPLAALLIASFLLLALQWHLAVANETIPATQNYGVNYQLPQKSIAVGDETVPAKTYLHMPDGTVVSETTVLNQYGKYTLEFVAEKDGVEYKDYAFFKVNYPVVSAQGNASYTEYVANEGLYVVSRCNYPIVFNNIIDISDMSLDKPLFTVHVRPAVVGFAEFDKMTIVLSDVYDSSNYITVVVRPHSSNKAYCTYFNAAANGQLLKGEDRNGTYHYNNDYGTPIFMTYSGETSAALGNVAGFGDVSDNFSLYLDYSDKTVYASNNTNRPIDRVADLDDEAIQETVWKGFTSNKVKMTVTLSGGNIATLLFSEVYGSDLAATEVIDSEAPIVTVDLPDTLPVAEQGKEYKLFDSSAIDANEGVLDTVISVTYEEDDISIPVNVKDNAFVPIGEGIHKVKYSAVDKFGNIGSEIIEISAVRALDPIEISVQGKQAEGRVAEWIDIEKVRIDGGSGIKNLNLKVLYEDGSESGLLNGFKFKPYKSGNYNVIYYATDYLGNVGVLINELKVNSINDPVFENDDCLPLVMLEGFKYELPDVIAVDYADGMKKVVSKIYVSDANNHKTVLDSNIYIPKVEKDGDKVLIEYVAEGKNGTVTKSFEPVVYSVKENDSIVPEKYFNIKGNAEVSVGDGIAIVTATDNATVTYINPVLFNLFKTAFRVNGNVKTVKVLLTDSGDANNNFYVALTKTSSAVRVDINGRQNYVTEYSFDGKSKEIVIGYDVENSKIKVGDNLYTISETPDFHSDKVFVSYQFIGVNSETRMSLSELNNHSFFNENYDYDNPEIYYDVSLKGNRNINEKIKIAAAVMGDVTDSYVRGTVTVKAPDGNIVKDVNGVEIKNLIATVSYEFVLEQYGKYTVTYNLRDSSQNRVSPSYTVTVQDDVPPVITVGSLPKTSSVGKTIKIEPAIAYDNWAGELPVYLTVIDPEMIYSHVKISDGSYTFTKSGLYRFVYYSVDQDFNISKVVYDVVVK